MAPGGAFEGLFGGGEGAAEGKAALFAGGSRFRAAPRAPRPAPARAAAADGAGDGVAVAADNGGGGDGGDSDAPVRPAAAERPPAHSAEELERTVFVGNVPVGTRPRKLKTRFGAYGRVESVRVRSLPLADGATVSRAVAARKGGGALAEEGSMNAYVKFFDAAHATAALAANMEEFEGSVLRVDRVRAPTQKAKSGAKGRAQAEAEATVTLYDPRRTVFVGGLPYDVREDELVQLFAKPAPGVPATSDYGVEAVRVVRERATGKGKGVAYVLFKTRTGAREVLVRKERPKLRSGAQKRSLRVSKCESVEGGVRQETRGDRRQKERAAAAKEDNYGGGVERNKRSRDGGSGRDDSGTREKKPRHRDRDGKDAAKKAKKTTASYEGTRAVPGAYKLAAPNPPRNGAKRPSVIARKQKQLKSKKGKK